MIFGGEALDSQTVAGWFDRYPQAPTRLINMYGITETTVHATWQAVTTAHPAAAGSIIGQPLDDLRLYTVDPHGNLAPAGVPGELYLGGDGLARAYLNHADLTAELFVPDGFSGEPGARLYRSGDLARSLPDGSFEYLGRIDAQVKVRGYRIEPAEIESALRAHPDVADAIVVPREDRPGGRYLVAYTVPGPDRQLAATALQEWLGTRLPRHMLPSAFVTIASRPLTANGKVDHRALPPPGGDRPASAAPYVAPTTDAQAVLADIWCDVLGVANVGIDDNFFVMGGDSIRSLQVLEKARSRGLLFTLLEFFQHQTVREIARHSRITQGPAADAPDTRPFSQLSDIDRSRLPEGLEDAYPLTALQSGMLYHMEIATGSNVYHNTGGVHIEMRVPFDGPAFEEAVRMLVRRHGALRTGFDLVSYSEPLQLVHRQARLPVEIHDIRALTSAEQERLLGDLLESEKTRPFDLATPTLLRFFIHLRTQRSFQFTITECHAIFDGWSYHSTIVELFRNYAALLDSRPREEPPQPLAFRDYVLLEREAVASPATRAFWHATLTDCTILRLPRWRANPPASTTPRIARNRIVFPTEVYLGLQRLVALAGVPLKSVLLAAHTKAMSILTGQRDVLTGMVTNGRPEGGGGDRIVGLFLNTVPLRHRISSGSWVDLARDAFALERALLPHRRYPLATIQRDLGRGPLCDEAAFNYMDFHVYNALAPELGLKILGEMNSEGTNFKLVAQFQHLTMVSLLAREQAALHLHYDADEFPDEQISLITDCYMAVLHLMTSDPYALHDARSALPASERRALLALNPRAASVPLPYTFHGRFEARARVAPHALAVVDDEEGFSYSTLNARANQLARLLQAKGIGGERAVGVATQRRAGTIVSMLAVLKAGGVYVPIDMRHPLEEILANVAAACIGLLLHVEPVDSGGSLDDPLEERERWTARAAACGTRMLDVTGEAAALQRLDPTDLDLPIAAEQLAYIIMTSGTTGLPKGVMVEHRSLGISSTR